MIEIYGGIQFFFYFNLSLKRKITLERVYKCDMCNILYTSSQIDITHGEIFKRHPRI